jgi:hypothetical protein
VDVTALGSCPMVGFDINGVKTLGSTSIKSLTATETVVSCHYFTERSAYIQKHSQTRYL